MAGPKRVLGVARSAVDLRTATHGVPSHADTYAVARRLHDWSGGRTSAPLARALQAMPWNPDRLRDAERRAVTERWAGVAGALADDGVADLPPLFDTKELHALVEFARHAPARLVHAGGRETVGTYAERSGDVTAAHLEGAFLWARPEIQRLLARGVAAEVATALYGARAIVHLPRLSWACVAPRVTDASVLTQRTARRFHADFDGLQGLRLHAYLTDVDESAAPMVYVRGSHRPGAVPAALRRRYGRDVPQAVIEDRFGASAIRVITGPAGTSFATNPHGLHRGSIPLAGDRLFMIWSVQAGAYAGSFLRTRELPVRDDEFGAALRAGRADLRLFRAAAPSDDLVSVARLVPTT